MTKGESTRRRIVEAAAPLFNQRGFAGCSMQDIMEATGLEKGGLYRHFTSKEELAAEAFAFALERSVKTRTGDLGPVEGAIPKLRYFVDRFVEAPSAVRGGCPLMNTAIDADDGNPVLRKLAREGFSAWKQRIANVVQSGIKRREIQPRTKPAQIANILIATLEGALMLSRLEGSREALNDARVSLNALLDSLACHT